MSLAAILAEDRRLAILRLLDGEGGAVNESVMQTALDALGHPVSRDVVRGEFAWLAEQGLVEVETVADHVQVARLTGRGEDVAGGRARVPGVKRPRASG